MKAVCTIPMPPDNPPTETAIGTAEDALGSVDAFFMPLAFLRLVSFSFLCCFSTICIKGWECWCYMRSIPLGETRLESIIRPKNSRMRGGFIFVIPPGSLVIVNLLWYTRHKPVKNFSKRRMNKWKSVSPH